jgi:hypothetical protein
MSLTDRTPGFGNHVPALGAELVVELAVIALLVGYVLFDPRGPTPLGE